MSIKKDSVTKDVTVDESYTDAMFCEPGSKVSVSVSGTFVATLQLKRSFDDGVTWLPIPNPDDTFGYTIPLEKTYDVDEGQHLKFGASAYTSGTAVCRLGKG